MHRFLEVALLDEGERQVGDVVVEQLLHPPDSLRAFSLLRLQGEEHPLRLELVDAGSKEVAGDGLLGLAALNHEGSDNIGPLLLQSLVLIASDERREYISGLPSHLEEFVPEGEGHFEQGPGFLLTEDLVLHFLRRPELLEDVDLVLHLGRNLVQDQPLHIRLDAKLVAGHGLQENHDVRLELDHLLDEHLGHEQVELHAVGGLQSEQLPQVEPLPPPGVASLRNSIDLLLRLEQLDQLHVVCLFAEQILALRDVQEVIGIPPFRQLQQSHLGELLDEALPQQFLWGTVCLATAEELHFQEFLKEEGDGEDVEVGGGEHAGGHDDAYLGHVDRQLEDEVRDGHHRVLEHFPHRTRQIDQSLIDQLILLQEGLEVVLLLLQNLPSVLQEVGVEAGIQRQKLAADTSLRDHLRGQLVERQLEHGPRLPAQQREDVLLQVEPEQGRGRQVLLNAGDRLQRQFLLHGRSYNSLQASCDNRDYIWPILANLEGSGWARLGRVGSCRAGIFSLLFKQVMSFDFFNEGIKKEEAVEFSKEEIAFLESKLPFLDPKKTQKISIGSALQFLKYSGIRSDGIQKILKNCNIQAGKKAITYDEMKKVLRGVALSQSDIEPSTINILANIKTKPPIFYDDDSDDDKPTNPPPPTTQPKQQPPPAVQPRQSQPPAQQRPTQDHTHPQNPPQQPVQDKPNVFSFAAPVKPSFHSPQGPHNPTQVHPPQAHHPEPHSKKKQSALSIKLREFQARWGQLKTEGQKIEGGEVKTLCKNLGQRSNLSKVWKLCSNTYSGALTKGQFFVFLEMVSSAHMPEHLTPQMKNCISLLDHPNNLPKEPPAKPERSPSTYQDLTQPKLASSQVFDNFGKNESTIEVRGRVKTEETIDFGHREKLQQVHTRMEEVSMATSVNHEETTQLRRGQETMNNLLGEVEQFLTNVNSRNISVKGQLEELKQGQQTLNERLNRVCIAMNGIIVQQNTLIEELANDYGAQNNLNLQRVSFLENHIGQLTEQLQLKGQAIKKITTKTEATQPAQQQQPQQHPAQQPQQHPAPQQQQAQPQTCLQVQSPPEAQEQSQAERPSESGLPARTKPHQVSHQSPVRSSGASEKSVAAPNADYEQRIKTKRGQAFQLIMHIAPVGPGEMNALVQRITEYTESELDTVIFNCSQNLRAHKQQQAQQQAANERLAQHGHSPRPPADEFSSSNFQDQPPPSEDMFQ